MPLNLFKVLMILLVFTSTPTKSSNEKELTTSIFDELREDMEPYVEDYYDGNDKDGGAYVQKYFPIHCYTANGYISRKHNCTRQWNLNLTSGDGDLILMDNQTLYPGFAGCARRKGYDLNRLACKKEIYYLYCGDDWLNIWIKYNDYDIFFRGTICVVGCLTNIINFTVLTRRNMANPLNTILAVLAISDFLFAFNGICRIVFYYYLKHFQYALTCNQSRTKNYIYRISYYTFHILSTYFTVLVAGWRFFGISFPLKSKNVLTKRNAKWAIFITIVGDVIYQLFFFFTFRMDELQGVYGQSEEDDGEKTSNSTSTEKETCSALSFVVGADVSRHYEKLIIFSFSLFTKWIPFVLLTIFTIGLLRSLIKTNSWRKRTASRTKISRKNSSKTNDKTNIMLLLILITFLLSELPVGVSDIAWWFEDFNRECLRPLGNCFSSFEYFSCSTSFFIFIAMSNMYRKTMIDVFKSILGKIPIERNDSKISASSFKTDTSITTTTT